jgi:hypothetical protein
MDLPYLEIVTIRLKLGLHRYSTRELRYRSIDSILNRSYRKTFTRIEGGDVQPVPDFCLSIIRLGFSEDATIQRISPCSGYYSENE